QNRRPKIFYGTQVATNPPTIVLFTNGPELFDSTYQRFLLKVFRNQLPFKEVPIKLYLRRKRREDRSPLEDTKDRVGVDISRLRFQSTVTDEELERDRGRYDSELWKDL